MAKAKRLSKVMAVLLALVMLLAVLPMGALATGDYELITVYTGNTMTLSWNGHAGTLTATGTFIPDQFTLFVEGTNSVSTSSGISIVDSYTEVSNDPDNPNDVNQVYIINTHSMQTATGTLTITVTQSNHNGTGTFTITVPKPANSITGGAYPASVRSYLPIGQFATGAGWGSSNGKFTSSTTAYCTTGVSIGAFGGYIEFDFGTDGQGHNLGISENSANPYGVDFVVYGNAFHNNPEAGAVQVSVDGTEWYELAGSLYYDGGFNYVGNQGGTNKFSAAYSGVLQNAEIDYALGASSITATLKDANNVAKFNNVLFTTATTWWPLTSEGYPMGGSHVNTNSNVQVSHSDTALSFSGITAIPDSNNISDYPFGYADVTPNGTISTYGTAVNPYTPYTTNNSKTGGDGFDLSWAVEIDTGLPADITGKVFRYVRVYSAVLDNGTFGETSTEVCGIFATANAQTNPVGTTTKPSAISFSFTDPTDPDNTATPVSITSPDDNRDTVTTISTIISRAASVFATSTEVSITATPGANVFVNSVRLTESSSGVFTGSIPVPTAGQCMRIIVQSGTSSAFIIIIK